ncbi:MAG: hypothetical protein KAI47_24585 [Deltaproteobacteria bacterium]|nr:hypothetical protein [Deltaproteobacteria bacterium]
MKSQELEIVVRLGIDLVVLVIRDDGYGMIKWKQAGAGFPSLGLDFQNPDSGGLIPFLPPPPLQDPTNKIPAMIFHGGINDALFGYSFKDSSQRFLDDLKAKGHFAFMCDHGGGHWLPGGGAGSWRFFQDHPFGRHPSPYAGGLPPTIPSYCFL